jgi:peptide deformylase
MAIREIIKLPHPTLKRKAHKVTEYNREFQQLVDDMIETMRAEPGVGLAAPQVNQSLRVIVVEYPADELNEEAEPRLFVVANPEFSFMSKEMVKGIEGCLSVPNLLGEVERSQDVIITGKDRKGKRIEISASGWLSRIFQHEIDHLNGILYVDRAEILYQPDEVTPEERV